MNKKNFIFSLLVMGLMISHIPCFAPILDVTPAVPVAAAPDDPYLEITMVLGGILMSGIGIWLMYDTHQDDRFLQYYVHQNDKFMQERIDWMKKMNKLDEVELINKINKYNEKTMKLINQLQQDPNKNNKAIKYNIKSVKWSVLRDSDEKESLTKETSKADQTEEAKLQ